MGGAEDEMWRGRVYRDYGAAVMAALLAGATPSFADLTFCNRSDAKMHLSLGAFKRDDGWISQGWWNLAAGECRTVIHGLPARVYFAFAIDENGRSWSAPRDQQGGWFCISPENYLLRNRDYEDESKNVHCENGNLKAKHFLVVNTGNSTNYTHNFTVRGQTANQPQPSAAPRTTIQPQSGAPAAQAAPPPLSPPPPTPAGAANACRRFPNLC
jgi:Protein of unknown function (DUF1036)